MNGWKTRYRFARLAIAPFMQPQNFAVSGNLGKMIYRRIKAGSRVIGCLVAGILSGYLAVIMVAFLAPRPPSSSEAGIAFSTALLQWSVAAFIGFGVAGFFACWKLTKRFGGG